MHKIQSFILDKTPLDIANQQGNQKIIQFLMNYKNKKANSTSLIDVDHVEKNSP